MAQIWMDGILIWLDGIPIYWTEFRSIGRNSDLLDGIPRDWTESCQSVDAGKKIGVDWPRPSQFRKKNLQCCNIQIEKSAWTGLGKVKRASSAASVFKISSRPVTRGSPKRFALRWPDLDKRCSKCYTLRGCVFADIQSREELKMLLQAKRQPG